MYITNIIFNKQWFTLIIIVLVIGIGFATNDLWLPGLKNLATQADGKAKEDEHAKDAGDIVQLSAQALKNIGYQPITVGKKEFTKTITIPAMVVERPGRSQFEVSAPMTGKVVKIYPDQGQAIKPGQDLFDFQLTHEDLVTAQQKYLASVNELKVIRKKVKYLKDLGQDVVAGRRLVEREYEQEKLEAAILAQKQGLLLHTLTKEQIIEIRNSGKLLQIVTIKAPMSINDYPKKLADHYFHLQRIHVKLGQEIEAGSTLATLADHCQLYIEGVGFEEDALRLVNAANNKWDLSAVLMTNESEQIIEKHLKIAYTADHIDTDSRALKFYIDLPNKIIRREPKENPRFIEWLYKPGQRMKIKVPILKMQKQMVLPIEAIVDEGAEIYVFRRNGPNFQRIAVHVLARDQDEVAIAADGAIYPGYVLAAKGAYQMQLKLKNKSGGGVDPHAGHNH